MCVTVNRKFDLVKCFLGKIKYQPDKGMKTKSQSLFNMPFNFRSRKGMESKGKWVGSILLQQGKIWETI